MIGRIFKLAIVAVLIWTVSSALASERRATPREVARYIGRTHIGPQTSPDHRKVRVITHRCRKSGRVWSCRVVVLGKVGCDAIIRMWIDPNHKREYLSWIPRMYCA